MKSNEALDARVSALEAVLVTLVLSLAAKHRKPGDEIDRVFSLCYQVAGMRLDDSQEGPEEKAARRAYCGIDRLYDLLAAFAKEG